MRANLMYLQTKNSNINWFLRLLARRRRASLAVDAVDHHHHHELSDASSYLDQGTTTDFRTRQRSSKQPR